MQPRNPASRSVEESGLRRELDPVRRLPPNRIPASTWCVLAAAFVFFWAYLSVNQQHLELAQAHAEVVVDQRARATMPVPPTGEGEVASVDDEWAVPEVFAD